MRKTFLTKGDPAFPVVEKWKRYGVVCQLDEAGEIETVNYAMDADGNFLPVPAEAVDELGQHYDAILADLLFWDRARDRVTAIWLQHDNAYRIENGYPPLPEGTK